MKKDPRSGDHWVLIGLTTLEENEIDYHSIVEMGGNVKTRRRNQKLPLLLTLLIDILLKVC